MFNCIHQNFQRCFLSDVFFGSSFVLNLKTLTIFCFFCSRKLFWFFIVFSFENLIPYAKSQPNLFCPICQIPPQPNLFWIWFNAISNMFSHHQFIMIGLHRFSLAQTKTGLKKHMKDFSCVLDILFYNFHNQIMKKNIEITIRGNKQSDGFR